MVGSRASQFFTKMRTAIRLILNDNEKSWKLQSHR